MDSQILRAVDQASDWLDIDGVEGVAPGERNGSPCIVVGVSLPPESVRPLIPAEFQGYPVVLENWGTISAGG